MGMKGIKQIRERFNAPEICGAGGCIGNVVVAKGLRIGSEADVLNNTTNQIFCLYIIMVMHISHSLSKYNN